MNRREKMLCTGYPKIDIRNRLASLLGVDGSVYRRQHATDPSRLPGSLREVVWGLHVRFEPRFPGCYIVSSDPAHRDQVGSPSVAHHGLFTAYQNDRAVKWHQRLVVCQRALIDAIARKEWLFR